MRRLPFSALKSGFLVLGAISCAGLVSAEEKQDPVVVIQEFTTGAGQDYFALAVKANENLHRPVRRHIVLIDTSASQIGVIRDSSLQLVSEVLSGLPANDQVQLFAVDVSCDPLTDGYVTTSSRAINAAIKKLSQRTPLGASDLKSAITCALKSESSEVPTSLLYIGDGITSANILTNGEMSSLVNLLNRQKCGLHSIVLGPKTNIELPGVLANLTGGTARLLQHGSEKTVGQAVAHAMRIEPMLVTDLQVDGTGLNHGQTQLFLRPDRHTVCFGEASIPEFHTLSALVGNQRLVWSSDESQRRAGTAAIRVLQQRLSDSGGVNAPIADLQMLTDAQQEFADSISIATRAAQTLSDRGETRNAVAIARQAAQLDESNIELTALLTSLKAASPYSFQENTADDALASPTSEEDDALIQIESKIQIRTQQLTQQTNLAIDDAVDLSFEQPEASISLLKDVLETIRSESDVSGDARAELERRVLSAIAAVQAQKAKSIQIRRQVNAEEAIQEAQRTKLIQDQQEDERLEILIDQVRGLLDRARHGDTNGYEDAEQVARTAIDMKPGNGPAVAALVVAEAAGQLDKARQLRELRADRFLATLHQVELSHVPFPDEPPVLYPPADVWRALTLTRKPKYESFDLRSEKPVEAWLNRMLDEPVPSLNYPSEVPLSEVLEQIATYFTLTYGSAGGSSGSDHRMTIWPDDAEFRLENILWPDEPLVNGIELEGQTLRNALKLIFDQTEEPGPALTYIIQNEVMLITTLSKAESDDNLVTRVYPVADLTVFVNPQQLGGGGLGGGQGGGGLGGGQQGGLGGGQGGGGFGGGQQGGGGGGIGAFSVPPEWEVLSKQPEQTGISGKAIEKVKKKLLQ